MASYLTTLYRILKVIEVRKINTESVNSGDISKNHDLDGTRVRSINFAGGVNEGIPVESTEIRSEVLKTGFETIALNIFSPMPHLG